MIGAPGILIFQLHNNNIVIEQIKHPERIEDDLMSTDIVALARDKNGVMWIGTNSGGLSHTTKKDNNGTWQFENYGIEDGMPSEEVRSITFDERGNVWFATDHIIASFDVNKKIFSTFSSLDGVDETMCSESAAVSLSNGKILFGTMNGYYVVDRSKLKASTGSLLRLRITDFYLDDQLQSPRLDSTFNYYIPESKSVTLPRNSNKVAFRFAALNYQLQHRIHYQYMMEGYDDDWQNADKTRTATYEGLPYGTYTFKVKAFLLESPEAYDMRTLEVVVPPPFLLSSTAIWIYLVLLVLIGCGWMLYRQRRLRKLLQPASPTEDKQDNVSEEAVQTEKISDEYEIIES